MADEEGQIAVDFLLGISLFLIALIFTVQFIPGMFMAGSVRESSLDYTAYRTATILTEDTGWWGNSIGGATDWENNPNDIMRIGLATDDDINSRLTDSPNLISKNKTSQLLLLDEDELVEYLGLYNKVDNTNFAYNYNISITRNDAPVVVNNTPVTLGDVMPVDRESSKITRVVLMEKGNLAYFDGSKLPTSPYSPQNTNMYINVTGPVTHNITLYINNLNLTGPIPKFLSVHIDGHPINENSDYLSYKVYPDGTSVKLEPYGNIEPSDIILIEINSGLMNAAQEYTIEIMFSGVEFTGDPSFIPRFNEALIDYYEPAYLTVEVWQ